MQRTRLDAVDAGGDRYVYVTRGGRSLRLSYSALYIVEQRDAGVDPTVIAQEFAQDGTVVSASDVERAYDAITTRIATLDSEPHGVDPFTVRWSLVSGAVVGRVSSVLRFMYSPVVAAVAVLCAVAGIAGSLVLDGAGVSVTSASFWAAYLIFFATLFVHELGHATAAERFGAGVKDIGAGIFLIFPALYADVTAAWKLPRAQRVVVDLGGVYFQACATALLLGAGHVWHSATLHAAGIFNLLSFAYTLTPFFRSDGYWVLSDALGLTSLEALTMKLLRSPFRLDPALAKYPKRILRIVFGYSALTLCLWAAFVWFMLSSVGTAVHAVPAAAHRVADDLLVRHTALAPPDVQLLTNDGLIVVFFVAIVVRSLRTRASRRAAPALTERGVS